MNATRLVPLFAAVLLAAACGRDPAAPTATLPATPALSEEGEPPAENTTSGTTTPGDSTSAEPGRGTLMGGSGG